MSQKRLPLDPQYVGQPDESIAHVLAELNQLQRESALRRSGHATEASAHDVDAKGARRPAFVPGKLHIRFKPAALHGAVAAVERGARAVRASRTARALPEADAALPAQVAEPLRMLAEQFGVCRVTPVLAVGRAPARAVRGTKGARMVASLAEAVTRAPRAKLAGYAVVELEAGREITPDVLSRIGESPAVEFVERAANRWTSGRALKPDPARNLQWGLRAIEWFHVARRPDAGDVHVAVLDTGVDTTHPDLAGVIANYERGPHSVRDLPGHGTHVAGIIAARANDAAGICGVANCRLDVWKVFSDPKRPKQDEEFDDDAYNQALAAVLDSPARIVNLSLGGTERSRTEQDLIAALVAEGALVIAAMGNEFEDGNPVEWPAAYADVLAVGAIGEDRRRASFSNTGRHINLVGPGACILSTVPFYTYFGRSESGYAAWPGTSMAAPCVAGVAALLKAKYPSRYGTWIGNRLQQMTTRLAAMGSKPFTGEYGHGLVNVRRAL